MKKSDIITFTKYVIQRLVNSYNLSEDEAEKAFNQSVVNKMLQVSPEFIMHYSIEINAKEVYDDYMGIALYSKKTSTQPSIF